MIQLQPRSSPTDHTCNAAWAPALTFLSSSSSTHPLLTALVKEYVLPQLEERLCPECSEESCQTQTGLVMSSKERAHI